MSDDGKLIVFPTGYDPAAPEALLERKPKDWSCQHRRVVIDVDAHKLFCGECDSEVDPLAHLEWMALHWPDYKRAKAEAQRRVSQVREDAERKVKEIKSGVPRVPMSKSKRLLGIARSVARAHWSLGQATAELMRGDDGMLAGMYLREAQNHIARALRSFEKLV